MLLTAFDGIGAGPYLVRSRPRNCHGSPTRGDITKDDPKKVAATIREADPNKDCLVLFEAAPPCQDFSPIGRGEGHQGATGRLFSVSADFVQAIFDDLPGYNAASIFENVLMNSANAKTVTEKLGCQPVFACAGDFGWVTRPRLWWLSVKWGDLTSDPCHAPLRQRLLTRGDRRRSPAEGGRLKTPRSGMRLGTTSERQCSPARNVHSTRLCQGAAPRNYRDGAGACAYWRHHRPRRCRARRLSSQRFFG